MLKLKRLDVGRVGDVTVARFRDDRISEASGIEEIAQELFHLVEVEHPEKLVVSLASVDFVSSAALGKLITLNRKVTACGGALKLSDMNADIALVFSVTQLDRVFDIEENEDDAIRAFRQEPSLPRKALIGAAIGSWRSLWAPHTASNAPA
jgi:anti-sigma B factor antagonist